MKEEFVNYEQALALKELGFDEPCFGYYIKTIGNLTIGYINNMRLYNDESNGNSLIGFGKSLVFAPLKQQVFRWFRDKHNIISEIKNWNGSENNQWYYMIHLSNGKLIPWTWEEDKTYEETEDDCIDKLISIVKEQNNK